MAETSLFPLDEGTTPDEELAAAAASARAAIEGFVAIEEPPEPLGMTWLFDFDAGRFVRRGGAPVEVYELNAIHIWAHAALRTARRAYSVFTDEFGMDEPQALVGLLAPAELLAEYEARIRAALIVHDRIATVTEFAATFVDDSVYITFTIFTDSGNSLPITLEVPV